MASEDYPKIVQTPGKNTVTLYKATAVQEQEHLVALPFVRGGDPNLVRVHVGHAPEFLPPENAKSYRVWVDSHVVQVEGIVAGILSSSSVAIGHITTESSLLHKVDAMLGGRKTSPIGV